MQMFQTPSIFEDPAETRAIGQFLGLAASAHVYFDLINDHLTVQAIGADWAAWRPLSRCLDEFGIGAIEHFFRSTTPVERERLFTAASCRQDMFVVGRSVNGNGVGRAGRISVSPGTVQ